MRVTDIPAYVRTMEEAIVAALAEEGIEARGRDHEGPQFTGVWVEDRKIASIGVHVSTGVSIHGFAVNVDNDVEPFHQVTACGLPGVRMTSIALETGRSGGLPCFRKRVAYAFARAHGRRSGSSRPARLGRRAVARPRVNAGRVVAGLRRRRSLVASAATPSSARSAGGASAASSPTGTARDAICWRCGAHERHRAVALLWRQRPSCCAARPACCTSRPSGASATRRSRRACATSPRTSIRRRPSWRSTSARSRWPDASFDAIICSHVLEHVDRDRDALAELRRVVAPSGWVLLMVPQDLNRDETYEDPAIVDPDARRAAYWQHDHVRLYGRDFPAASRPPASPSSRSSMTEERARSRRPPRAARPAT